MPIKVVAFTGSLRKASVNAGLLRAAATLAFPAAAAGLGAQV